VALINKMMDDGETRDCFEGHHEELFLLAQFFSVGLIALLGPMLPGPDFAIVVKNSMLHSRRSGIFTSLGVGSAIFIHMSYCVLGLAFIISSSLFLFNIIKYVGASYLIYIGIRALCAEHMSSQKVLSLNHKLKKTVQSSFVSFRQGFFCNLLNPKATLFFLSIFTVLIKPDTSFSWKIIYAIEIISIATGWFCALTFILSHRRIKLMLEQAEKAISQLLGISLIGFGIVLLFARH
jgi:RhtB (resistance to homoserine/threonine) family protein